GRIGWIMLALPLLPIVGLLFFSLIAWYEVGRFPSYGSPDPNDLGMGALYTCALLITLLTPYVWLLSTFSVVFLLASGLQQKRVLRNLGILILTNGFYIGFMLRDPLGLLNWIAD
ncbi:MAG TPA: hypothetical protein VFB82_01845, partial [Blastocatellia bacterium]|nr:hypothetical protein [Blastocatellia bacterium]